MPNAKRVVAMCSQAIWAASQQWEPDIQLTTNVWVEPPPNEWTPVVGSKSQECRMEGRQRRSFTERSISNSASIRRTTSIAIGESAIAGGLAARILSNIGHRKNGRRACDQHAASRIGPGLRPARWFGLDALLRMHPSLSPLHNQNLHPRIFRHSIMQRFRHLDQTCPATSHPVQYFRVGL
jgi:hypothetical protein